MALEHDLIAELEAGDMRRGRRRTLVKRLAEIGGEPSVSVLTEALGWYDFGLSVTALQGLARIGTPEAVDAIIDCLRMDPKHGRFTLAVRELERMRPAQAVPALIECLEHRADELPKRKTRVVLNALGRVPDVRSVPVLAVALRDRRYGIRVGASWALLQIREPESVAALEEAARDLSGWKSGVVRRRARLARSRLVGA